jgi:hypothetical protein
LLTHAIVTQESALGFSCDIGFSDKPDILTARNRKEETEAEGRVIAGIS